MRDRLIHAYSEVDLKLVWTTIHQRLPKLKSIIEKFHVAKVPTPKPHKANINAKITSTENLLSVMISFLFFKEFIINLKKIYL